MKKPLKLIILISGNGSNLQAIIDACESGRLNAKIVAVISNRADAYGLKRAEAHHILSVVFRPYRDRTAYDIDLGEFVAALKPDIVVLAGWMRILSNAFLSQLPDKVINLHPALPGQFAGVNAISRAFEAAQQGLISETGVMVHWVVNEGVDDGPIIASQSILILPNDTLEQLAERIHAVEHELLVNSLITLAKRCFGNSTGVCV